MSESNDEFNEKMSIVAEYDVKKVVWNTERGYGVQMSHGSFIPVSMLGYSTDWNKLNPVWAKVDSSLPSILNSLPNGKRIQLRDSFNKLDERYYKAVRTNNITEAFNVVCDAITLTTKP